METQGSASASASKKWGGLAIAMLVITLALGIAGVVLGSLAYVKSKDAEKTANEEKKNVQSIEENLTSIGQRITWGDAGSHGKYVALVTETGAQLRFVDTAAAYQEGGSMLADYTASFGPMVQFVGLPAWQSGADQLDYGSFGPLPTLFPVLRYPVDDITLPPNQLDYQFFGSSGYVTLLPGASGGAAGFDL